jgi:small subunit ribosomal protein S2
MSEPGLKDLLQAGVHFGHQTRKWNPKMRPYIFIARGGIYIIDLQKTQGALKRACAFLRELVGKGGDVLFVGTKKQAKVAIKESALRCGMPYVTERWLGGMLTNFQTIYKSVQRLEDIEAMMQDGRMANFSKKEQLEFSRTYEKLIKNLGGIRKMKGLPKALFVIDTNCDPDLISFPVPGNDDAIRSINLFARTVATAIEEGLALRGEGRDTEVEIQAPPAKRSATPTVALAAEESEVAPVAKPAVRAVKETPPPAEQAAVAGGEDETEDLDAAETGSE